MAAGAVAAIVGCTLSGAQAGPDATNEIGDPNPEMTIKIYNNAKGYNIYPVLSTGTSASDPWLQSVFKVPKDKLEQMPFPKPNQFRIYINPTGAGIPPGESVTITLPLYSELVPKNKIDPKKPDQYIDWWGGARIEIFDAPVEDGKPPKALRENYKNRDGQVEVFPIKGSEVPICPKCQPFKIFKDPAGLKHNEPSQLTEYTLGALNLNKDPIELNDHNVDFDVSYVDDAYLPIAMEPFGNKQVGYVGMVMSVSKFRKALNTFLDKESLYAGWPQFVDNQGDTILKVPSTLHVFGGDPDLTPEPWPPIDKMIDQWNDCVKTKDNKSNFCKRIRKVRKLFQANYDTYKENYTAFGCDPDKKPIKLDEALMRQHVQGWGPFNEFCSDAKTNLLEQTPGYKANNAARYQKIKEVFDKLQYMKSGKFNPYALMIHSKDYVGAPNVYAYSVDDAVGNMQADGTGLVIAVGGKRGLPNGEPATPPIHVAFGYSLNDSIRFTRYGICTNKPDRDVDPDFPSFDISITSIGDCKLTFLDTLNRKYVFQLKSQPPYPEVNRLTPATHAPIDCSGNTHQVAETWCENIFAYTLVGPQTDDHFAIAPALPQTP